MSRAAAAPNVAQTVAPFAQVKQHLRDALSSGRFAPGDRLPSEAELVAQFGVSRMTVGRALRELQAEGLVDRVQGVGSFAAQPHRMASTLTIRDLHDEIAERGGRHRAEVKLARQETASAQVAQQLGVAEGAPVFHTILVHFDGDRPLQCEDRFVNPDAAPDYLRQDFTQVTPTHHLLRAAPLWQAQVRIEAGHASAQEAKWLGIGRHDPCLIVLRHTRGPSHPITLARLVHPGSRHALEGRFAA